MAPTPSAEMPMPGGPSQIRLLDTLESAPSLYRVSLELPRLATELQANPGCKRYKLNVAKTVDDILKDQERGFPMTNLLHSMHKDVVKAIVGGTVALDTHVKWYQGTFDNTASGVYVIGLERRGHQGKFLTGNETKDLIRGLDRYLMGAAILKDLASRQAPVTQAEQDDCDWVKTVDKALDDRLKPISLHPRFVVSANDHSIVEALVASFESRCHPNGAMVRQLQSPLYVGCSSNLKDRLSDYQPQRWLRHINKPLALTVSVLAANRTPVNLVPRVAMSMWEKGQLSLAERLVTTLAASLACQTGFNATQAGASHGGGNVILHPKSKDGEMNTENRERNSAAAIAEMQRRMDFINTLQRSDRVTASLEADSERLEEDLRRLNEVPPSVRRAQLEGLDDKMAEMEKTACELEAAKVVVDRIRELERLGEISLD